MRGKKCLIKIQYSERLLLLPVVHYNCRASAMIKGGDLTMTTTVFLGFIVLRLYILIYPNEKMIEEAANPLLSTNLFFLSLLVSKKKVEKRRQSSLADYHLHFFIIMQHYFLFYNIKKKTLTINV